MNFYSEHDPNAAAWLRELVKAGEIPPGDVDERDIQKLHGGDLVGYTQVHLFAGIGGWPLALRYAGWPSDRPVWTGSCPCQSFSAAGKGKGQDDPRHLWPHMFRLIGECRPVTIFGEQVEAAIGHGWLDGICADLEGEGYAVGQVVLGAHSAGAPHIRQRLWWVADAKPERARAGIAGIEGQAGGGWDRPAIDGAVVRLEHAAGDGREQRRPESVGRGIAGGCGDGGLGNANSSEGARFGRIGISVEPQQEAGRPDNAGAWSDFELIQCADGKSRRTERGLFPLAHGIPGRVGLLRGYGNAIVPQIAAAFVTAYMESVEIREALFFDREAR